MTIVHTQHSTLTFAEFMRIVEQHTPFADPVVQEMANRLEALLPRPIVHPLRKNKQKGTT